MTGLNSITASPNPIVVPAEPAEAVPVGTTTLSWSCANVQAVEVHVDAPDGPLFYRGGPVGTATTGRWVHDGMTFYLLDASPGVPSEVLPMLATVTVSVRSSGQAASWQSAFLYLRKHHFSVCAAGEAAACPPAANHRPSIVVLSGKTANNLGDDAILIAAVRDIRRLRPDAAVTVLAEDPGRCGPVREQIDAPIEKSLQLYIQGLVGMVTEGERLPAILSRVAEQLHACRAEIAAGCRIFGVPDDFLPGLRCLLTADGVFDCGGASLTPRWKTYFYEKCLDYLLAPKPLFISGQGIDPLDDPDDVELLRRALALAGEITVREKISERYLRGIGYNGSLVTTGDDALTLEPSPAERAGALMKAAGLHRLAPFLAAQFRYWQGFFSCGQDEHRDRLARYSDQAIESTGLPVLAVPMHFGSADERDFLRAVRERATHRDMFHVVEDHIAPGDAKALFSAARLAFGISYHSAVFCLSSAVPFIGLYEDAHYTQKIQGLAELYGVPDLPLPLRSTTPEEFGRAVRNVLENRERVAGHLRQRNQALLAEVLASRERFLRQVWSAPATRVGGNLTAVPNPVPATRCGSFGSTTLSWTSESDAAEVHVDAPDGPLLSRTGATGAVTTGEWVRDGMVFYLQDVSGGKVLGPANTLASITVRVNSPNTHRGRIAGRALILMYHRVAEIETDPWSLCVTPRHFAEHLEILARFGCVTSLSRVARSLREGTLPERSIVLTFDDGYADNFLTARPLLERHGIPATVFVASGAVGGEREFWWDELERPLLYPGRLPEVLRLKISGKLREWVLGQSGWYTDNCYRSHRSWRAQECAAPTPRHETYRSLHRLLMPLPEEDRRQVLDELHSLARTSRAVRPTHRTLSTGELLALGQHELFEIGGHTATHACLSQLTLSNQQAEIETGKAWLELALGRSVTSFAYPYGACTAETLGAVQRAGFLSACSTVPLGVEQQTDVFQLPRITVEDCNGEEFLRRLSGSCSFLPTTG